MSGKITDDFKDMVDKTSELVKSGNFDEVLRMFNVMCKDRSNPEFVGALKMIANGMKAKGEHNKALKIYESIYQDLTKKCGLVHKETLTALSDVISTTRDISTTFKYLSDGTDAAIELGDESLIETFDNVRTSFFEAITPTQKRLYIKLENNRKKKKKKTEKEVVHEGITALEDVDDLMERLGL
jgi:pentatricopeptide repeat protein